MLKNNFLFGIGPGNFQSKYLEYQKYFPPYLEWAVPEPHNLYLAFWLESGFAGFTGFVILTFLWLKRTTFQTKNSLVTAVCAGIMLYFLLHGILDTTYWKNDLSLIFWITFSLGLLSSKIYSVKPSVNFIDKK
jgi:O-antigen ligase